MTAPYKNPLRIKEIATQGCYVLDADGHYLTCSIGYKKARWVKRVMEEAISRENKRKYSIWDGLDSETPERPR